MGKYIMALDQGTTSSRCILFDTNGNIVSCAQEEFLQIFPKPGWVEHNPMDIWNSQQKVMNEALKKINATPLDIAGIGITNQRETTIIWDKNTGNPIYNAIVWQCRRTSDKINKLKSEGFDQYILKSTGLIADAYFSASKIEWILENVDGAKEKVDNGELLFGTVDTWLMWKLSNGAIHATDYTNASRTMLFNIHSLCWDDTLLDKFNVPKSMLPKVQHSGSLFGYTDNSVWDMSLWDNQIKNSNNIDITPVPICGVAGDQQAALFGQCCFEAGMAKNTYGTGCFLLMNTGEKAIDSTNGLLTTIAATSDKSINYALEGSVFIAGAAIQWLRDELKIIDSAPESEDIAKSVSDTNGVYIVPAFTGLGTPHWNPNARGSIFGLTRGSSRAHIIRATLESLAYQTYDVINAMELDSGIKLSSLKVDGGASHNSFLLQFQADILNTDVLRPSVTETTALGAAYLAGLTVGYWKDKSEIQNNCNNTLFKPTMDYYNIKKHISGWQRAINCAKMWGGDNY